ncbi:MAG: sugar kinase [Gemmatimonadaceae bacterium]
MTADVGARVVTFGELLLRLSPPPTERLFQSPKLSAGFGGSEANVAVGLAHLGVRADYVTVVPDNPVGDAAVRAVRAEGVDTRWVVRGGERMGLYFVEPGVDLRAARVVYDRRDSAFAHLGRDAVDWSQVLNGASWLHGSGITPALGAGPAALFASALAGARAAGARISVDLNYRPLLWRGADPRAVVQPLVADVDLLIANQSSAQAMLGVTAEGSPSSVGDMARALAGGLTKRTGCRTVAVTRREVLSASEHGWSAALHDCVTGETWQSRRYQVRVVDRVGGGDSFAAALLYAMTRGWSGGAAVEFAAAASALKLTVPGDFNRVTLAEIEQVVRGEGPGSRGPATVAAPSHGGPRA